MNKIDYFLSRAKDEYTKTKELHTRSLYESGDQYEEAQHILADQVEKICDAAVLTEQLTFTDALDKIRTLRVLPRKEELVEGKKEIQVDQNPTENV